MKKIAIAAIGLSTLVAVPVLAAQQPAPKPAPAQPLTRAAVQAKVQTHFQRIDANRDGYVTKAEAEAQRDALRQQRQAARAERRQDRFARLDANKDGAISQAEFTARSEAGGRAKAEDREGRGPRLGGRHRGPKGFSAGRLGGGKFFERADGDKDGRLSLAEATAAPLARFDRADANRDGTLTREEMRTAHPKRGGRPDRSNS